MPEPRHIAEQAADLKHELISLADRLSSRSIIFTDLSLRRDLQTAAAGLRELAGMNRMVDQPVLASKSPAAPGLDAGGEWPCRCRDRGALALERWGVEPAEARDIATQMLAAERPSERLKLWLAIEPRFRESARQRQAKQGGTAPGRPARPDPAAGGLRDLAGVLMGVSSRTAGRMLEIGRAVVEDPERYGELMADMDHNGVSGAYRRLATARAAARRSAPGAADAEERIGCPLT